MARHTCAASPPLGATHPPPRRPPAAHAHFVFVSFGSLLRYAEADPTLDVGGFDARSKLKIIIKLAFGVDVHEEEIPCRGITEVSATDFEYAKLQGGTVKLLGVAKMDAASGRLSAFVSPCFVPTSNVLASINGATNAVQIASTNLQNTVLVGQGAGRMPTANSCVSDILDIAQGISAVPFPKQPTTPPLKFGNSYSSSFYVRIRFRDQLGIIQSVGEVFAKSGVSIYNLLQVHQTQTTTQTSRPSLFCNPLQVHSYPETLASASSSTTTQPQHTLLLPWLFFCNLLQGHATTKAEPNHNTSPAPHVVNTLPCAAGPNPSRIYIYIYMYIYIYTHA